MWKPSGFFEVERVSNGWGSSQPSAPVIDDSKKQAYGIELAKINAQDLDNYLKAACEIFPDNTGVAMWAAQHWPNDPVVVASRDAYEKTAKALAAQIARSELLDKEGLAAKLLSCAEEKITRNGQSYYVNEAKDRHNFYKLYSEVMGFTGKALIDASTNNFTNNEMKIVLVKPEVKQETKAIEIVREDDEEDITNITPLRIKAV